MEENVGKTLSLKTTHLMILHHRSNQDDTCPDCQGKIGDSPKLIWRPDMTGGGRLLDTQLICDGCFLFRNK